MNRPKGSLLLLFILLCGTLPSLAATEDVCECIKIRSGATDTLIRPNYFEYKFTIKNTCTNAVWINTGFFGFSFYDVKGRPIRKLRELTFVKRYKYPEYVLIAPNAEYEFKFSDDAFFEYKLEHHTKYVAGLNYSNKKAKHASKKSLNYLCTRELKRFVYVK